MILGIRWIIEEPNPPEVVQSRCLPLNVLQPISDLVLELPVLVEDQCAATEEPDAPPMGHVFRGNNAKCGLQFPNCEGEYLHILGHSFAQHESIWANPNAWPDGLYLHITVFMDFKRHPIFPYKSKNLVAIP